MKLYTITRHGANFGAYPGNTEAEALDALARGAGYRDYAQAQEFAYRDPTEMIVTEVAPGDLGDEPFDSELFVWRSNGEDED